MKKQESKEIHRLKDYVNIADIENGSTKKYYDSLYEDWKECRATVRNFDSIIMNLRKFGFTIITGFLSANSFIFIKFDDLKLMEKVIGTIILLILIIALYILDRYYDILLRAAVRRSVAIEKKIPTNISFLISAHAEKAGTNAAALGLYGTFIFISSFPLIFTSFSWDINGILLLIVFLIIPIMIFIYIN